MNDLVFVTSAYQFAAVRHAHQRRKGAAAEPYLNHLVEVADLVARATEGRDPNLIAAAVLHDTVEDVGVLASELETLFNVDVAGLVLEVTDDKSLEKAERKRLQVANAVKKSPRARLIKLADKTSNLRAIALSPPAHWDAGRKLAYLAWARQVIEPMRGTNAWLEGQFDEAAQALEATLAASKVATPASA